jgi:uncharacterized membrane protein
VFSKIHNKLNKNQFFVYSLIFLLILGIFFRFYNLDRKIYWNDEAYTSLRLSGYTETEVIQQAFNGTVLSVAAFQKYQHPNPDRNVFDTIHSLAVESPQHPPLYYVIARFWEQLFGHSIGKIRLLSAFISLLVFPAIYWLCIELFDSAVVGCIAIALIAISPFHVLYAQEAREYSLWAVTTLLSSAALLRSLRRQTWQSWAIYAVTLTLNLYTFLFSIFVAIAQGLYVLISQRCRWSQTTRAYLLAAFGGILAFLPWLIVIIKSLGYIHTSSDWTSNSYVFGWLLQRWLIHLGVLFFDINLSYQRITIPVILILIIIGLSWYYLGRYAPKKAILFLVLLMAASTLPLMLPDVILGGKRSTIPRYQIPFYLGIQISIAYFLAAPFLSKYINKFQRSIIKVSAIILIFYGIFSCTISSQNPFWWNKSFSKHQYNKELATIINQADNPLLISDDSTLLSDSFVCRMLSFSYDLNPNVQLQLVRDPQIPQIPESFRNVFVFSPSQKLIQGITNRHPYQEKLIFEFKNFWLWKLTKINE